MIRYNRVRALSKEYYLEITQPNTPHAISNKKIVFLVESSANATYAEKISNHLGLPIIACSSSANYIHDFINNMNGTSQSSKKLNASKMDSNEDALMLCLSSSGLSLQKGNMSLQCDFQDMLSRIKPGKLQSELLVKAAKIKSSNFPTSTSLTAIDATAGLGQDSFLLAAAGFSVHMYEQDPIIATLLRDALQQANHNPNLFPITKRMHLHEENSILALQTITETPDVIYLDPMFPARTKSAAVKKKFQLLHELEHPCENEEVLLQAAEALHPRKIVVKRMLKGPCLAQKKPSYSLKGKSIRYDCYV